MATENGRVEINIDGTTHSAKTPEWMLDKTARDIKSQLSKSDKHLEGILKVLSKQYDESKTFEEVKDALKDIKANTDPSKTDTGAGKNAKEDEEKATNRAAKSMFSFEHAAIRSTKTLTRFVSVTATAAAAVGAFAWTSITSLGDQLSELTRTGVGLNNNQEDMGMSALDTARQMGQLGIGVGSATEMMGRFSRVLATGGRPAMLELTRAITENDQHLTQLGMTTAEATEEIMQHAYARSRIVDMEQVDRQRLAEGTLRLSNMQRVYSTALGRSTEELRDFAFSVTQADTQFGASVLRFSQSMRNDAVQGVQEFATKMAALGGEAGQEIASSMIDAAAMGGIGFSDSMVGVITAVPRLSGAINQMTADFRRQDFSNMDQYADQVAQTLGNLTQSERTRIFALARTGDQAAMQMAQAVLTFEQTEDRIEELNRDLGAGLDMDRIQEGTVRLQSAMGEMGGMLSSLQLSFVQAFSTGPALEALEAAVEMVKSAFEDVFGVVDEGSTAFSDSLSGSLAPAIQSAGKLIASFVRFIPTLIKIFEGVAAVANVLGSAIKIGVDILSFAFNILKPVLNFLIGSFNLMASGVNQVAQGLGDLFSSAMKLGSPFGFLARVVSNTADNFSGAFQPVIQALDTLGAGIDRVVEFFEPLTRVADGANEGITGFFGGLTKFVLGTGGVVLFGGLAVAIVTAFQATVLPAMRGISKMIGGVGSRLGRSLNSFRGSVAEIAGRATGQAPGRGRRRFEAGQRLGQRRAAQRAAADGVPGDDRRGRAARGRGRRGGGLTRMANSATRALTAMAKAGAAFSKAMIAASPGIAIATGAILGIAAALRIATPAIKALVPLGIKLAEVLGGVLTMAVISVADVAKTFVETVGKVLTAAMENTFKTFELFLSVDPVQLYQAAGGITAIGVAMASLGAGQAAQGVGSFIGNLFGGDTLGKMMQLAGLAPQLEVVESVFNNFGNTIANFNSAVNSMNADNFVNEATRVAASIRDVKGELGEIGAVDMVKLALVGGSQAQPQSPSQSNVVENNTTTNNQTTVQNAEEGQQSATPVQAPSDPARPTKSEELLERAVVLLDEIRRYTRNSERSLRDR